MSLESCLCLSSGWFVKQTADLFRLSQSLLHRLLLLLSESLLHRGVFGPGRAGRTGVCRAGRPSTHTQRLEKSQTQPGQLGFRGDRSGFVLRAARRENRQGRWQHIRLHARPLNSMHFMDILHLGLVARYCLIFCVVLPGRVASGATGTPGKPSSPSLGAELGPRPAEEVLGVCGRAASGCLFYKPTEPQEKHRHNHSDSLYA